MPSYVTEVIQLSGAYQWYTACRTRWRWIRDSYLEATQQGCQPCLGDSLMTLGQMCRQTIKTAVAGLGCHTHWHRKIRSHLC